MLKATPDAPTIAVAAVSLRVRPLAGTKYLLEPPWVSIAPISLVTANPAVAAPFPAYKLRTADTASGICYKEGAETGQAATPISTPRSATPPFPRH